MAKWVLEPGHTAAEFCARHMMVTWVRGHFKNVRGTIIFDPADPRAASAEVTIDAAGNPSDRVSVQATPAGIPLGRVNNLHRTDRL